MRSVFCIVLFLAAPSALDAGEATPIERLIRLGNRFLDQNASGEALRSFDSAARLSEGPCTPCETGIVNALLMQSRFAQAEERAALALQQVAEEDRPILQLLLGRARLARPGTEIDPQTLAGLESSFRAQLETGLADAGLALAETLTRLERDEEARSVLENYLATEPGGRDERRARELSARPHCGRESCLPLFETAALDETVWNNDRLAGHVVLLDFWATWCRPCIDALPELRQLAAERADQPFTLLGLTIDEDERVLRAMIQRYAIDWPQIWDPEGRTVRGRFGVRNFPTYVLVDHTGVVRGQYNGSVPGLGERLAKTIDALLEKVPSADPEPSDPQR